jgi:arylsulfatase
LPACSERVGERTGERKSADLATRHPGDILLITVDTLRADHLGIYGYGRETSPEIDRFFLDGTIVERAYSTEANTTPSVVSILTGLLPQDHRVRLLYQLPPEDLRFIPNLLPDAYQTAAFVANIVLTDEAIGLAQHFDHYDDYIDENVSEGGIGVWERSARRNTDAALAWLHTQRDSTRPLFLWIHYIDPHAPYRPPDDGPRRFTHEGTRPVADSPISRAVKEPGVTDALAYVDRYDEEIAFMDAEVGRLLKGYGRHDDLDRALVLLTADHGESMLEHEWWFAHGYHVYEGIVRVPLLVRGPGVPRRRIAGPCSGIDVAPTVLAFAGTSPPPGSPGVDLRGPLACADERVVYTEAAFPLGPMFVEQKNGAKIGVWRAAIRHDQKWMMGLPWSKREVVETRHYDLQADPEEQNPDRSAPLDAVAMELRARIAADPDPGGVPEALRKGITINAPKVAPRATDVQRERLRALGYVE